MGIRRGFEGGAAKLLSEGGPEVRVVLLEVPPLSGSFNAAASGGLGFNLLGGGVRVLGGQDFLLKVLAVLLPLYEEGDGEFLHNHGNEFTGMVAQFGSERQGPAIRSFSSQFVRGVVASNVGPSGNAFFDV